MGASRKTKTSKYEDAIEEAELDQFKRVQMSKKELRALQNQRETEMQDRLEDLDDDFKAIESIVKRSGQQVNETADDSAIQAAQSKFAKSLQKQQKFSQLKDKKVKGDALH